MQRITKKQLNILAHRVNVTMRTPTTYMDSDNNVLPGHYGIEEGSTTYGRSWKMVQTANAQGGESTIIPAPTAKELFYRMHAFIDGVYAERKRTK